MQKLLIFSPFFPPHSGGLETHVYEFTKYLSKENYNIVIFTPNIPKTKEIEIINKNLKVIRYPAIELFGNPIPLLWTLKFWKLFREIIRETPDFVMSRTRFFFSTFLAFLYAKIKEIKYIHVEHGSDFLKLGSKYKDFIAKFYDLVIGRLILTKADICISISKSSYNFVKKFRRNKIYLITRGLEINKIEKIKSNKEILKKFRNKIRLCFCGRLVYWKGLHNALEGFLNLEKKLRKNLVFIVIGDGPNAKIYKKKYNNPNIKFLGQLPREKALSIIKSCNIFIHPTISGGALSSSLLEAMCLGKAIIASPSEGANEVIFNKKTGILLKKSSPKEFEIGIKILIKDKKLQKKLGKNAKKFANKNFVWKDKIKQYVELFKKN